jgi:hypothetical protein
MSSNPTTNEQYQQVVVQVPEDRIAEFHAFFGRFLAGPAARRRSGRHGRPHHGLHRHRCGDHGDVTERGEATGQPAVTEV